jgi:16S rRNA processing protein RimM
MMDASTFQPLVMAKIGAPFGIKGWSKITNYGSSPQALLDYQPWFVAANEGAHWVAISIEESLIQKEQLKVRFSSCSQRDHAEKLTNLLIAVDKGCLPSLDNDNFYWQELQGYEVFNAQDEALGQVDHLFATGANDVMVVLGDKKRLIPFIMDHTVITVDRNTRRILVDWGLDY